LAAFPCPELLVVRLSYSLTVAALLVSAGTLSAQTTLPPATPPAPPAPPAGNPLTPPAAPAKPAPAPTPDAPTAVAPTYLATRDEALTIGRQTAQQAYTNQLDALLRTADPADGDTASMRLRLTDALPQVAMQLGAERRMIREQVMKVNGRIEYWRTAEYEMVPVPLIFRVIMGAQGKWRGFTATTEEQAPAGEELLP
jgi:hypothetical protein